MSKGKFIVLEGIDGSGTTTQCHLLRDYLNNLDIEVLLTKEPTDLKSGQIIRNLLKTQQPSDIAWQKMALLFAADRLDHINSIIIPALKKGVFVICDRYVMSSYAYQGAFVDKKWVEEINKYAITPDLTILLDLPAEIAYERVCSRNSAKEIFDVISVQKTIRDIYVDLVQKCDAKLISADDDIDKISQKIFKIIEEKLLK